MDKKICVIAIVIENGLQVERVNNLLHIFRENIVGRMGLPFKERGVSVISVVLDTTPDIINSLTGKLGMLEGVTAKAVQTK